MTTRRLFFVGLATSFAGAVRLAAGERFGVHFGKTKPCLETGIPGEGYQYRPRSASQVVVSTVGTLLQQSVTEVTVGSKEARPLDVERQQRFEEIWRDEQGRSFLRRQAEESSVESVTGLSSAKRIDKQRVEVLPPPHFPDAAPPEVVTRSSENRIRTQASDDYPTPRKKRIALYQLDQDSLTVNHCAVSEVALQLHSDGVWVLSLRADQNRVLTPPERVVYNPTLHLKRNEFVVRLRCLGAYRNTPSQIGPTVGKPVLATLDPKPFWVENGQPYYLRHPAHEPDLVTSFELIDRVAVEFFYR